jgi:hypothetical protein
VLWRPGRIIDDPLDLMFTDGSRDAGGIPLL